MSAAPAFAASTGPACPAAVTSSCNIAHSYQDSGGAVQTMYHRVAQADNFNAKFLYSLVVPTQNITYPAGFTVTFSFVVVFPANESVALNTGSLGWHPNFDFPTVTSSAVTAVADPYGTATPYSSQTWTLTYVAPSQFTGGPETYNTICEPAWFEFTKSGAPSTSRVTVTAGLQFGDRTCAPPGSTNPPAGYTYKWTFATGASAVSSPYNANADEYATDPNTNKFILMSHLWGN